MKSYLVLLALSLCLLVFSSCKSCGEGCGGDCQCETTETMAEVECAGCAALIVGGTGWCADCGSGFHEGQMVNCQGSCAGNPGGPPCAACVK